MWLDYSEHNIKKALSFGLDDSGSYNYSKQNESLSERGQRLSAYELISLASLFSKD